MTQLPPIGLIGIIGSENIPIPLKQVNIEANVIESVSEIKIVQEYQNLEENAIEAIYVFPLPINSAITEFKIIFKDREILGEIESKESALEKYKEALEHGQSASILEEMTDEMFKISAGNIPPGSSIIVCLSLVSELRFQNGKIDLIIPMTIAPKYGKSGNLLQYVGSVDYRYSLSGSWESDFLDVSCDSHDIELDQNAKSFLLRSQIPEKDIRLSFQHNQQSSAVLQSTSEGNFLMLTAFPQVELNEIKCDFVFVIDCSGSMQGFKIDQTREALKLFLKSLPQDCFFNIFKFGTTFEHLFQTSRKYSQETLHQALQYADGMDARMGGTEMFAPISAICSQRPEPNYSRQIFVLTDGEIMETEKFLSLVEENRSNSRFFSLGIGNAVSHYLVNGIAEKGGGQSATVMEKERIDSKVIQQLKYSMQESITSFQVSVNDPNNEAVKYVRSDSIFSGTRFLMYLESINEPQSIGLEMYKGEEMITMEIPVIKSNRSFIQHLATKRRIKKMEESLENESEENVKEIVDLSKRSKILSKFTTLLAVDSVSGTQVPISKRIVPLVVDVHGGQYQQRMFFGAPGMLMASMPPPMARSAAPKCKKKSLPPQKQKCDIDESVPKKQLTKVQQVASWQNFDGSFSFNEEISQMFGLGQKTDEEITFFVTAYMEIELKDFKDEWLLLHEKSIQWLLKRFSKDEIQGRINSLRESWK